MKQNLFLSEQEGRPRIMQKLNKAFELFDKGEYKRAEKIYLTCLSELTDDQHNLYKAVLNGLGYVKSHQGQFEKAKQYFKSVLEISIKQADKKEEAMALHQLGMVERMAGEFEKALYFFTEEEKIWKQHYPDFLIGFSANSYERGYIAIKQERYERALELFQSALALAKSANSPVAKGCAYRGMGELEIAKLRFEEASIHFQHAMSAFEAAGDSIAAKEIRRFLNQCQHIHSDNIGEMKDGNKGSTKR